MNTNLPLCTRLLVSLVSALVALPSGAAAQETFSDSSRLSQPSYVNEAIREIDDAQLWSSIDLNLPGLQEVRLCVQAHDYERAARVWTAYWSNKKQPAYVTVLDHLLIDTDMLVPVDTFRVAMEQSSDERGRIIARADEILTNTIRTWGDNTVAFGEKVDFNRDIGQSGKYGFHYWFWSRPLIMASVITGEDRYAAKFDELFHRWYEQRNSITRGFPLLDVVYYELGLATRSRSFIEYYLLPYRQRSERSHERMLKTLLAAGRWLYELQKWEGYRPGNWQIHGAYTLLQLALVLPEFRESAAWHRIGLQRLMEHLDRDFFPDGGHSERSPRNYTLATYMSYRNMAYLLGEYGVDRDAAHRIQASMGRTIDWWKSVLAPTGEVPAINDSHRGLFPERVLRDGERLFALSASAGRASTSRHMPESGFTVMRSDSTSDALYMILNYGPFAGFHTHYDLLDFEIYAYGKALAVDAGIGSTYDDPLYPTWYRSSRAHNMVVVNDSSIEREGIQGENIVWKSTSSVEYFSGEHEGYRRFAHRQRRQIAFVKPSYWFVLDDLHCGRANDTLSWYFHSPVSLLPLGQGFASQTSPGIHVLPAGIDCLVRTGKGMAASTTDKVPGKTEEIGWIRFDQLSAADAVVQFPILLFPYRKPGTTCEAGRISERHFIVRWADSLDHLYFPAGTYKDDTIQTDASFLLIREGKDGRSRYVVVNGTYLKHRGKSVWASDSVSSGEGEFW